MVYEGRGTCGFEPARSAAVRLASTGFDYEYEIYRFEQARDVYEEAIASVVTVRDFSMIFDAYSQFEESMLTAKLEAYGENALNDEQQLDVDGEGQNGLTPLCLAARSNKLLCARVLVEAGADPRRVTAFGKSALDIARTNKRAAILKLFGDEA